MNKTLTVVSIIAAVFVIIGGLYSYDQRVAKATDVLVMGTQIKLLYEKFDTEQKIRRIQVVQERIWILNDRYLDKKMPQSVLEELRRLEAELKILEGR